MRNMLLFLLFYGLIYAAAAPGLSWYDVLKFLPMATAVYASFHYCFQTRLLVPTLLASGLILLPLYVLIADQPPGLFIADHYPLILSIYLYSTLYFFIRRVQQQAISQRELALEQAALLLAQQRQQLSADLLFTEMQKIEALLEIDDPQVLPAIEAFSEQLREKLYPHA
ncbi:hypothetical protein MKQ68_15305 [Chitinophaga horti]|uniref:Histidine kinase n=1 Tax=Chitinophaga horti TaxID=2920382 RepID=A0ABY6IVR7_9BACT|nr:hypothetical protein [Chitinophaga horti]UYQ91459.1 hypothetical protein MKQ68_15305 [Chitinophaga horti]